MDTTQVIKQLENYGHVIRILLNVWTEMKKQEEKGTNVHAYAHGCETVYSLVAEDMEELIETLKRES